MDTLDGTRVVCQNTWPSPPAIDVRVRFCEFDQRPAEWSVTCPVEDEPRQHVYLCGDCYNADPFGDLHQPRYYHIGADGRTRAVRLRAEQFPGGPTVTTTYLRIPVRSVIRNLSQIVSHMLALAAAREAYWQVVGPQYAYGERGEPFRASESRALTEQRAMFASYGVTAEQVRAEFNARVTSPYFDYCWGITSLLDWIIDPERGLS